MENEKRLYDLLIVTDVTGSMGSYLQALNESLPEIIRMSALTGCFSRIGIVAYRDYCGGKLTEWSGWHGLDEHANEHTTVKATTTRRQLLDFAAHLVASHGGDWPEATKTGLAKAYSEMRDNVGTMMILYADAPPHLRSTKGSNWSKERLALRNSTDTEAKAAQFADWISLAKTLSRGRRRQARVYSIIGASDQQTMGPYAYLSRQTGGACFQTKGYSDAATISTLTLGVLLTWMGVSKDSSSVSSSNSEKLGWLYGYRDESDIDQLNNEDDPRTGRYWDFSGTETSESKLADNCMRSSVTLDDLKQHVRARKPAVQDFSKRYLEDETYRQLVVQNLEDIIRADVATVAVNPVFGSLWRTVCADRKNEARDGLLSLFSTKVEETVDVEKKGRLKKWLAESYDYAVEILDLISSVPEEEQFPCVFLDPTLDFAKATSGSGSGSGSGNHEQNNEEEEEEGEPARLTRPDLLEIGRSCDPRILRRLGRLLTHLTYVETKEDLPDHIRKALAEKTPGDEGSVACIPMALVCGKYGRKFWKVLLHVVLSGTMLGPRAAAVLAALSLRMGLLPLQEAADTELLHFRKHWNTLDIPETWNTHCLALLLYADADYEKRVQEGVTVRVHADDGVLASEDRRLFKTLVDYKLAEANLNTTLTARVGWRPEKTRSVVGPLVVCRVCKMPRSVTIMAAQGICGCCAEDPRSTLTPEEEKAFVAANVSTDDKEDTNMAWVECAVPVCRAQYVVYNTSLLKVRPKCFYCRTSNRQANDKTTPTTAPYVECKTCLSRMIWPQAYRPPGFKPKMHVCPACVAGRVQTIVDVETCAAQLMAENGSAWLLRNVDNKISAPFQGRSLFYVAQTAGTDGLADAVEVLPSSIDQRNHQWGDLTLKDKTIRNTPDLVAELRGWIDKRRTQHEVCSLCFQSQSKSKHGHRQLRSACGRRGCSQRICDDCHRSWFALNARGRILNIAALHCPFCRRQPAAGVVSAYRLSTLGGLRDAVRDAGSWVYAWCNDCGFAKRLVERVCAQGAPIEVDDWVCEECQERETKRSSTDLPKVKIMKCPSCHTPTEKLGGCDHISCSLCKTHWCFECGEAVDSSVIYAHMSRRHGGWYGGQMHNDDYLDED